MSLKVAGGRIQDYLILLATENVPLKGNQVTVFKLYLFFFFFFKWMPAWLFCVEKMS